MGDRLGIRSVVGSLLVLIKSAKSEEACFDSRTKIWLAAETEHCHRVTDKIWRVGIFRSPGRPSLERQVLPDGLKFGRAAETEHCHWVADTIFWRVGIFPASSSGRLSLGREGGGFGRTD